MRNLLVGNMIRLTAMKQNELGALEAWFNEVSFLRYYDMLPAIPQSNQQLDAYVKDFEESNEKILFAIRTNDTEKLIGIAGFDEIIWSNGVATVFIGIGDANDHGKGLGTEAMALLLDFGFNELNFHRIQLSVISYNQAAIKMYESLGFIQEGTYREFICRDGKRFDLQLYGLLNHEWRNQNEFTGIV